MLIALNYETGLLVDASAALKYDENGNKIRYICPECKQDVILKQGIRNIPHFSHVDSLVECSFNTGESHEHMLMKYCIKQIIEEDNNCLKSELEYRIGNRIADYYCEIRKLSEVYKIAIECVHKNKNITDFREKNEYYAKRGIYVLWVFNAENFFSYHHYNPDVPFEDHYFWKKECRTNQILRESHDMYFDQIFAISLKDGTMWGIHFETIVRYNIFIHKGKKIKQVIVLNEKKAVLPQIIPKFVINRFEEYLPNKVYDYHRNVAKPYMKSWWFHYRQNRNVYIPLM